MENNLSLKTSVKWYVTFVFTMLKNDAKYSMTFNLFFPIAAIISVTEVDSRFNILSLHSTMETHNDYSLIIMCITYRGETEKELLVQNMKLKDA